MGLKQVELVPISSNGPTALTPAGKPDLSKFFQVARTDTAAGILKAVVPAQSSLIIFTFFGSVNSNAGTTAAVTITVSNNSGVVSTGTVNVLTNGATTAFIAMSNLPTIEQVPANGDYRITAQYAETGGASSAGGPWVVRVLYV